MEENFGTRLKLYMDAIGVQSSQFADSCEIPRPSFSQLLSGRNQKVSDVLIKKIHSAYPDLSIMWLIFGEGDMLTKSAEPSEISNDMDSNPSTSNSQKSGSEIPEFPYEDKASSGYSNLRGLTSSSELEQKAILQQLEENKRILELQLQIENLQKNPRKVTQITVYYDDSTFETFVPSK
ncbi:MAG: hypothetical protein NC453_21570 [Muribaculum sp.]|nr:hypothetical protein [Muribaculum sp.]